MPSAQTPLPLAATSESLSSIRACPSPSESNRTYPRREEKGHIPTSGYIAAPSQLWVFADENPDTINDGWFRMEMGTPNQWDDMPGSYHSGACPFTFADGHAELHKWRSAETCPPVAYARKPVQDPGSPDIRWMRDHTTVPFP